MITSYTSKTSDKFFNKPKTSNINISTNFNTFNLSRKITKDSFGKTFNNSIQNETLISKSKNQSRINEDTFNHFNQINDFDEVQKLKKLFLLYSTNDKTLTSTKFLKFLSDAHILDKNFNHNYADIIFFAASRSKSNVDFQKFCEIMVKISEIKFPEIYIKNQEKALVKLFNEHLFNLLEMIIDSNKSNHETTIFNWETYLSKLSKGLNSYYVEKHFYCLNKIYSKYFNFENLNISDYQKSNLSEKAFFKFCKDFDICPNIVSLIKLNEIFETLMMNTKLILNILELISQNKKNSENTSQDLVNQGTYFTLYHFIAILYLISIQNLINSKSKFVLLKVDDMDNNEDSKYFNQIIQNFYKTEAIKNIFPRDTLNENYNTFTKSFYTKNKNSNEIKFKENFGKSNSMLNNKNNLNSDFNKDYNSNKYFPENYSFIISNEFLEKHKEILITVYKYYSDLRSETNFSIFMHLNGFIRFMKDLGLLYIPPNKNILNSKIDSLKLNSLMKDKIKNNQFPHNYLNLLFAKFSSETFKPIRSEKSKNLILRKNSNKGINFESFIKILCCTGNKLFNTKLQNLNLEKNLNTEMLLNNHNDKLENYLENLIDNYLITSYNEIKTFVENESFDLILLEEVYNNKNVENFMRNMRPILVKIFLIYSHGKSEITLDEFLKYKIFLLLF